MNKVETSKLLNKIKGYYNSQFFIDDYVLEAWMDTLEPYDLEDAIEHLKNYIKENPDTAPRPQTFIRGMVTHEEKLRFRNGKYTVECNLCGRWMPLEQYEDHYDRCLDIQYLVSVAKQKGEDLTREDLESCKKEVIDKLLDKYPPERVDLNAYNIPG